MKQQIHPKLSITTIQMTDGSFFIKKWLFFRDFLPLEIDLRSHSGWLESQRSKTIVKKDGK